MKTSESLPPCVLIGTDGNAFSIIGRVVRALKRAGQHARAAEFQGRAMSCGSYDLLLGLCFEYVEVL